MTNTKQITKGEYVMIIVSRKVKQAEMDVMVETNKMCKETGRPPMYDYSKATVDLGSITEQFLNAVKQEQIKLSKGEQALAELVSTYGTQFPMKLNGQAVVIRINGAKS